MQIVNSNIALHTFTRIKEESSEAATLREEQGVEPDTEQNHKQSAGSAQNDAHLKELQAVDTTVRAHEAAHPAGCTRWHDGTKRQAREDA